MLHVVMYSGGISSWAAAKRTIELSGETILVFADTGIEDEDVYRFIRESADRLCCELVTLKDGRNPWEVFYDVKFLGNHRIDPCSRILKRDLIRTWLEGNCDPDDTEVVIGYDWTEPHRIEKAVNNWADPERSSQWTAAFPLADPPYLSKLDLIDLAKQDGLSPPRMYAAGFAHANCGGFCIKAGQGHYATLLQWDRGRYLYHEQREQDFRAFLAETRGVEEVDVTILTDRSGGNGGADRVPLTLRTFRERLEAGGQCDMFDVGGCACMDGDDVTPLEQLAESTEAP